MITNERQYRITAAAAERFKRTLDRTQAAHIRRPSVHPRLIQAEREGLESQLQDLRHELAEYEALKRGDVLRITVDSFDELGIGLIKARVAAGLSQKALAERLHLKEQQIQRYEAERYASASYRRLREVVRALGVSVREEILFPDSTEPRTPRLLARLRHAGLKNEFVLSRLLPSSLAATLQEGVSATDDIQCAGHVAAIMGRIFGWTPRELLGTGDLPVPRYAAAEARFKMPARRRQAATGLYATYANYLATIVVEGCRGLAKWAVPTDDADLTRQSIEARYGRVTFVTALYFAWDLGVPVLPLRDPGTFHGACWRYEGRNVIVLKQTTNSEARWLFDLIHELYHAGQNPDSDVRDLIELDETSSERRDSEEEIAASEFAGNVILGGRADALAKMCVTHADKSVERLKRVVPLVAEREGVSQGVLANYLAFRMSCQGVNWWGTAANLQHNDQDPWETARRVFFERFPFKVQAELDRQLLQRAFEYEGTR